MVKNCDTVPYESLINARNQDRATKEGIDLLRKMLVYDKNNRITPRDAMQHEYYRPVRGQSRGTRHEYPQRRPGPGIESELDFCGLQGGRPAKGKHKQQENDPEFPHIGVILS